MHARSILRRQPGCAHCCTHLSVCCRWSSSPACSAARLARSRMPLARASAWSIKGALAARSCSSCWPAAVSRLWSSGSAFKRAGSTRCSCCPLPASSPARSGSRSTCCKRQHRLSHAPQAGTHLPTKLCNNCHTHNTWTGLAHVLTFTTFAERGDCCCWPLSSPSNTSKAGPTGPFFAPLATSSRRPAGPTPLTWWRASSLYYFVPHNTSATGDEHSWGCFREYKLM